MVFKIVLSCAAFLFSQNLSAKIRILTFHCNHCEFLEYQCKALEKFLLDDYELIVFNDGVDQKEKNAIQAVCARYGVKHVSYKQSWHKTNPLNKQIRAALSTPHGNDFFKFPIKNGAPDIKKIYENVSVRHCHLIQYALDHYGYDHDDIVVIMDGDVFAIQPISIRAFLDEVPIVGIDSEFRDKHYLWVPFIAFDPKRLPNLRDLKFHIDLIDGLVCDTGSHSYQYLKNNPEVTFKLYPRCYDSDFFPYDVDSFARFGLKPSAYSSINWPTRLEFYVDHHFIHFCGGSGLHPSRKFFDIAELMGLILEQEVPVIMQ
jgi:hypothetical protein